MCEARGAERFGKNAGVPTAHATLEGLAGCVSRHEQYLDRFFTGYDDAERTNYVSEMNCMAEWNVRYRAKYELEKKVLEWVRDESRILVIGTRDHTSALTKYISDFYGVNVVGFIDFNGRPELLDGENVPYAEVDWESISDVDFDEILVSSFEFMYDISARIRELLHGVDLR